MNRLLILLMMVTVVVDGAYRGILLDGVFSGWILSDHDNCKRHWVNMSGTVCEHSRPRYHIIACRFGGESVGKNCQLNTMEQEVWWTAMEEKIAAVIPTYVLLLSNKKIVCIGQTCHHYSNRLG